MSTDPNRVDSSSHQPEPESRVAGQPQGADRVEDCPAGEPARDLSQGGAEGNPGEEGSSQDPSAEEEPASERPHGSSEASPESGAERPGEPDKEREPLELLEEAEEDEEELPTNWYILKVQVNREESIREALQRRVKLAGLEHLFSDIVVPTEDVAEFTKSGKRRIVKKKLYPGYIMVRMAINDDTWFVVRETPGIGDFTGSAGKPTPMGPSEVERILSLGQTDEEREAPVKTAIPYKAGDRVRVKEGHFLNFEGDVESVDEANGRVTVMINIFGRSTPVELEHWQIESV